MFKKWTFCFFLLFLMTYLTHAQNDIEIVQSQNDNILTLVGKNLSETKKYRVNLALETQGFKITPPPPYEFVLDAGGSYEIVKLIAKKGENTSLGYKIQYEEISSSGPALQAGLSQDEVAARLGQSSLILFTKESCEKSGFSKKYLNERHLPFVEFPLESAENSDLLWSALFNQGYTSTQISTPIFVVKGKLVYDVMNIEEFLKKLTE